MPKKSVYTNITPIPSYIPRQLAIDMLHSHGEIIELNPLVVEHHPVKAPHDAPADEFFSQWYEITERIQYIPGTGKLGSGKISFKGVFHDMPWGLQTHVYAPAGVDIRNKWQIRGNQPGEPPEQRELGSAAPADGLYLREDVEIKCNFTMVSFVKSGMKAASKVLVERMIKKAELIDAEIMRQMMNAGLQRQGDGTNPSSAGAGSSPQPPQSPGFPSPGFSSPQMQQSATMHDQGGPRNTLLSQSQVLRKREEALRQSAYLNNPAYRSGQWNPNDPPPGVSEMTGSTPPPPQQQQHMQQQSGSSVAIELPGDYYHPPQKSPNLQPPGRGSTYSELGDNTTQSHSRPSSVQPDNQTMSSGWGGSQTSSGSKPDAAGHAPAPGVYRYNPQDFAS